MTQTANKGFTLFEIAIAIVIIGLLVGGVMVGRDALQSAALKAYMNELSQYKSAIQSFRLKYNQLPGDMRNAEEYQLHQVAGTVATCQTTATPSYNGDGNGVLDDYGDAAVLNTGELANFWFHLANSELLDQALSTGVASCAFTQNAGTFYPQAEVGGGLIAVSSDSNIYFILGYGASHDQQISGGNAIASDDLLPIEASRMDRKLDDGDPLAGQLRAVNDYTATTATTGDLVDDPDDSATNCIFNAAYNSDYDVRSCTLSYLAK